MVGAEGHIFQLLCQFRGPMPLLEHVPHISTLQDGVFRRRIGPYVKGFSQVLVFLPVHIVCRAIFTGLLGKLRYAPGRHHFQGMDKPCPQIL